MLGEELPGGCRFAVNERRQQLPYLPSLKQTHPRLEVIQGLKRGSPGQPHRWRPGATVMDSECQTFVLDSDARGAGKLSFEPTLRLKQLTPLA